MTSAATRTKVSPRLTVPRSDVRPIHVLVIQPHGTPMAISCRTIDEGLEVVRGELKRALPGATLTLLEQRRGSARVAGHWKVSRSGARRYRVNQREDQNMEYLMRAARSAYIYGRMSRVEVIEWLMREHDANRQQAVLASAAGKVLAETSS